MIMSPNITNQIRWSENEVHVAELLLDMDVINKKIIITFVIDAIIMSEG